MHRLDELLLLASKNEVLTLEQKKELIDELKARFRNDVLEKNYVGLCPFHTEKTPSFTINRDTWDFRCFSCGNYGKIKLLGNSNYPEFKPCSE